jgi:hypothetical protein
MTLVLASERTGTGLTVLVGVSEVDADIHDEELRSFVSSRLLS